MSGTVEMCIRDRYYAASLPVLQSNFYTTLIEGRLPENELGRYMRDYQIVLCLLYTSYDANSDAVAAIAEGYGSYDYVGLRNYTDLFTDARAVSYTHLSSTIL